MSISNVKIQPMLVYLGANQMQVQTISCIPGATLGGKYFLFHDSLGAKRYAWFNTGTSVDPAPAGGWTGHAVAILAADSATIVASKLSTVLNLVTGFDSTSVGAISTLTHTDTGYAQPARDALGVAATGFAFKVTQIGSVERSAGCIQGDIELSGFEQDKVEITCHASGTTVKSELVSGYQKPTLGFTLQETNKESIKKVMLDYGMYSLTPVGADSVEVFGYGPNNVGGSNPTIPVRLHPVALDTSDKSEDWNVWKGELSLDTFTFSGESVSTIPVSLSIFPDESKPKSIQFFMIGDAAKAGY